MMESSGYPAKTILTDVQRWNEVMVCFLAFEFPHPRHEKHNRHLRRDHSGSH